MLHAQAPVSSSRMMMVTRMMMGGRRGHLMMVEDAGWLLGAHTQCVEGRCVPCTVVSSTSLAAYKKYTRLGFLFLNVSPERLLVVPGPAAPSAHPPAILTWPLTA